MGRRGIFLAAASGRQLWRLRRLWWQCLWQLRRLLWPHRWRRTGAAEGVQEEEERASSTALTKRQRIEHKHEEDGDQQGQDRRQGQGQDQDQRWRQRRRNGYQSVMGHQLPGGWEVWYLCWFRGGGVLGKILRGKSNQYFKQIIILPQTKYQRGKRISFPRKRGNSTRESKRLPLHPPSKCKK